MKFPGAPSLFFLAFILVLVPFAAWRTALRLRNQTPGPSVPRLVYWKSAVLFQCFLFILAWAVGGTFAFPIFAVPHLTAMDVSLAFAALAVFFGLRSFARATRSEEERKTLSVYERAPRTGTELAWFSAAVVAASVAEEAAYRGVGMSILWFWLGNPWIAALLMSIAFALAHWNQGWKSGLVILAFAGVFHALVYATDTLVLAMLVHAAYDFIAGDLIRRQALRYDQEADSMRTTNDV